MKPSIEIIPARPFTSSSMVNDLLVRITPPAEEVLTSRPPLDLALVLDSSGSMQGLPLQLAKEAVLLVGQALTPKDRLALVTFASTVQIQFPLQAPPTPKRLQNVMGTVQASGSTALHRGWQLGATLLHDSLQTGRLTRVLLLTDGRANVGLCQPQVIAADVAQSLHRGVSTSAVGVGMRYDEQLLEAVAGAGDGNYHFAETPEALPSLFNTEMESLRSTVGRLASLGISGVEVIDVLNDLSVLPTGRLALPPLRAARPLDMILRVNAIAGDTLALRLAWTDAEGERHTERVSFALPLAREANAEQPEYPEVVRVRAGLLAARAQREVARLADAGNLGAALSTLNQCRQNIHHDISRGVMLGPELETLNELEARLVRGERHSASKFAKSRAYSKTTGRDER